jgi:hypothetical protein
VGKVLSAAGFPGILLAGIVGQKIATALWARLLGSPPPDTAQQDVRWIHLIPAAIVEGTLYKLSRMLFDRGLRLAVARTTGNWPGETGQGQ